MFYKIISSLILLAGLVSAQSVAFQVTASQGDGSACNGIQNPGTNVNFTFTCVAQYQGRPSGSYRIYEGGSAQVKVPVAHTVQFGDVLCMFGDNPTNFPVTIASFLAPIPAHSIAYNCVENVRSSGAVTGNVAGPNGIVTWGALTAKRSLPYRLFHPHL